MARVLKICHDKVLPQDIFRPHNTIGGRRGSPARAVFEFRKMWINGSNLRVRFIGGSAAQRALAREQARWWAEHANLTFEFGTAPDAEIRVAFDSSDGAWSYIGTDCRGIPQNQPTMNLGFQDGGTSAHEFGHAIALGHEHQNPAGGIQWNEAAVIRDLSGPPNNWTEAQIRHNVLEKYSADQIRGTSFDSDSIMLYFFPARWTLNGQSTKANEVLSTLDKAFIAGAEAYPRTSVQAVELRVNAPAATAAQIGAPGEEDVFLFKAATRGRHVVETSGQTDVVMKLFGPNSQTSLIAEDDDGGAGLNSRIVADLLPGEYFVQIRHYNRARGTGSYGVRVRRGEAIGREAGAS
ncbi:MAG: M12 family metallopeptidase [Acidobacteria bacterium]|nr:M12 family metallopeptidase [Acidobacteriota bacterium]MCI0627353.1 M12 family metallopeptidase [Acidobacteriota bacterium]MCI0723343.1 M12 family metallopeptidase [Acidobacteriota bacterium]